MSDTHREGPQDRLKNVAFTGDHSLTPTSSKPVSTRRKWVSRTHTSTNFDEALIESRALRHAQIIRRPRAFAYSKGDTSSGTRPGAEERILLTSVSHSGRGSNGDRGERSTDDISKQLDRLSLFVDLVWVGIIANLSATFGEQAFTESGVDIGLAILEFILLFLPIWRVWNYLRAYSSDFFTDDVIQRNFIVWILILSVLYGINAPYAFSPENGANSLKLLLSIYLIIRGSFLAAQLLQCISIPFLRRQFLFRLASSMAPGALWLTAIFTSYPAKLVFLVLANAVEQPIDIYLASPLGDRLLPDGWKKTPDVDHCVERYEGFFIIILGEGVFRLIEGSPSGMGLNHATGIVLTALLMYYVLHWLYFNGDQSKEFVHALRRNWWKPVLWQLLHVALFGTLLLTTASTLFLVEHQSSTATQGETEAEASQSTEAGDPSMEAHFTLYALWTASVSLSAVIFSMTCIALLNSPLDPPKTLVINSRLLRMAPRVFVIAVLICLPLFPALSGGSWCGAATCTLYAEFLWEWIVGLERDWTFVEPKVDE